MLTSRTAAPLLAGLATVRGVSPCLAALGFPSPQPLEASDAAALGVPPEVAGALVAARPGLLRALVLVTADRRPLPEFVARVATRVGRRAPHLAWCLIAVRGDAREVALSAWLQDGERLRRATLLFEPARVLDSDAETLAALAAAATGEDTLVHRRWFEILGREALSARFYRSLERAVVSLGEGAAGDAPSEARRTLALTTTSRLLFLSFLQSRGWLDGHADFLASHCDAAAGQGPGIHRGVLEPLFFGTLNTPLRRRAPRARAFGRVPFLNGGLFARTPLEQRYRGLRFRDEEVAALFDDVLTRFRFTVREDHGEASEAAIDPEMLGRAFESLMASRDRRESGAFYTPQELVERTTDAALSAWLEGRGVPPALREQVLRGTALTGDDARLVRAHLEGMRVLDPACGSGAFLVHALHRLTSLLAAAGDPMPRPALTRRLLTQSLFGVDVNPMAVWLCELRLWLATTVDLAVTDPMEVPPLPNLDRNVRVGDALDLEVGAGALAGVGRPFATLRTRYARATGRRKLLLLREVERAERQAAIAHLDRQLAATAAERRELVVASRGRDLFGGRRGAVGSEAQRREQLRRLARQLRDRRVALREGAALPFHFASHFPDALAAGGFDLVVGNPPWVRLHRIPADRRDAFRSAFRVFREAAWTSGAAAGGASPGFAAQVDLAALFAEQGLRLTAPGGVLALLLPMKLWRALSGGGVRELLGADHRLCTLEDWSDAPAAFDAAAYPSLTVVRREPPGSPSHQVTLTVHKRRLAISWPADSAQVPFDRSPGAPWLLLPPDAVRAFRRLVSAGIPMAQSSFGSPSLGVKCGCNDAFLVEGVPDGTAEPVMRTARGNVRLEASLLRPVVRGERVSRWHTPHHHEWIVWTHGRDGRPLPALPPATQRWLTRWRRQLMERSDARSTTPWWSLFRVEGSASDRPRVVWADVSRGPRATVLAAGAPAIPLNSCYVLRCRDDADAATMVALLNSPLVAAWLDAIAEPARGGYRRYMAWTVACLPLPGNWARAREVLAPIGAAAVHGSPPGDAELLEAACQAYGVGARALAPLVEWVWR